MSMKVLMSKFEIEYIDEWIVHTQTKETRGFRTWVRMLMLRMNMLSFKSKRITVIINQDRND